MKRCLAATVIAILLSFPPASLSLGPAASISNNAREEKNPRPSPANTTTNSQNQKASELLGMNVHNLNRDKLGDINEVVVELSSGRVVFLIMSAGSFLGLNEKFLALPPGAFQPTPDRRSLMLNADRELLREAPAFGKSNWPVLADREFELEVYRFYAAKSGSDSLSARTGNVLHHAINQNTNPWLRGKHNTNAGPEIREAAGAERKNLLSSPVKVSELIGTSVKGARDERLGEIKDLLLNISEGKIVYAVVASGGFLGFGNKLHAVSGNDFGFSPAGRALVLNKDIKDFSALAFPNDRWPEHANRSPVEGPELDPQGVRSNPEIREPAGAQRRNSKVAPDITAQNARDRRGVVTAGDQSEARSDRELTRQIRSAIYKDKFLSFGAKNIKIITINGQVTLRGAVKSEDEAETILGKAHTIAGTARVDNQLDIKQRRVALPGVGNEKN